MSPCPLPGSVLRGSLLAALVVGVGEGIRVATMGQLSFAQALGSVALITSLYVLVSVGIGAILGMLLGLFHWGNAASLSWIDRAVGWLVVGVLAAIPAFQTVAATAGRNNRFLAAGVVALVSIGMGLAMAFLGPAISRAFSILRRAPSRPAPHGTSLSAGGVFLLLPVVVFALELGVFWLVWRTRAPLRSALAVERGIGVGLITAILPFAAASAAMRLRFLRGWLSGLIALGVLGGPLAWVVHLRWTQDFQFLPWADVGVIAALLVATGGLMTFVASPLGKRTWRIIWIALAVAIPIVLLTSESEAIRKPAMVKAGLVGRILVEGQRVADFDGDGYARFFGGGDCDDGNPEQNPGARDWPDDGIDQDCDGKDATAKVLRSPPFFPVPDTVPKDLNILLVTIDTLRADHLGTYGYARPTSPRIDELAKESTVFENGWAHAPSTRYSMPAIVTGRWPSAIAWDETIWWPRIAPTQRTLGESLKSLGFATGGFFAYLYFNLADRRGFERGIDHYDDTCAALHTNVNGPAESVGSSARQMSDKGIDFIRQHASERFFTWLHYYDPHLNYERHPEAPDFGNTQKDLYDGEIWFTDREFGRVLDELRRLDLWKKTAIVVVGDHGESLGEHGIVAHGYHLYSPHTKVPFIFRIPGLPAQRLKVPVGHVDLAPTLVNLARGPHEPAYLGRSLVDLLAGAPQNPPPGPVFQEVSYEGNVKRRALVTSDYHLIWNWTPDNTTECYNLKEDPGEETDRWGRGDATCVRLKNELRDWVGILSLPPGYGEKIAFGVHRADNPPPPPRFPMEAQIGQGLRVLGYDLDRTSIPSGATATLVTHFQLAGSIEAGFKPFFHLEGPGGFRNLDHVLVEGAYPIERWQPGQRIRDRMLFSAASNMPPGSYTLYIGLYKGSERAPVTPETATDGNRRLRLVSFRVE